MNYKPKKANSDSLGSDDSPRDEFNNTDDFKQLKKLYDSIKEKYRVNISDIAQELEKKELLIPCAIFNTELTTLQTLCKYLKENLSYNFTKISILLNRNPRIIWRAYNLAKKRLPEKIIITDFLKTVPISIFSNREMSIMENMVAYLKEKNRMKYSDIAKILKRDDRTIWTVYNRAKKKANEK